MENEWGLAWYEGDFEKIFSSKDFRNTNAYEDGPWFAPDFYKVLFHRFPQAKFILFERDPDSWFESMLRHSGGNVIGSSRRHCKIYRRELEFFDLLDRGIIDERREKEPKSEKIMKLYGKADHYKNIYRLHNREVKDFFYRHSPESLHVGSLEDLGKWQKLGGFLGVDVPKSFSCHVNASKQEGID